MLGLSCLSLVPNFSLHQSAYVESSKFQFATFPYHRNLLSLCLCMCILWTYANGSYAGDNVGNQNSLRFPPFHQAMLTQDWWNAGENLGRIRVIIAEGILNRAGTSPPFTRTRNIVSFSFQHAPLSEYGYPWAFMSSDSIQTYLRTLE